MKRKIKNGWTQEELDILAANWKNGKAVRMWADLLPRRTERAITWMGHHIHGPRGRPYESGNSMTWRSIQRVLADGSMKSALEIALMTGLDRNWISRELMNHYPAMVHIGGYGPRKEHGYGGRLWRLGTGKDAQRPRAMTAAEIEARRWRRLKKDRPDVIAARTARQKLQRAEKAGKLIRRDPAAAWFGTTPKHTTP